MFNTEKLSPDPAEGGMPEEIPVKTPEEQEKAKKILKLYEKAVLSQDFDTADSLDTSIISPEELLQTRVSAFDKLTKDLRVYSDGHYTSYANVKKKIESAEKGLHLPILVVKETKETFVKEYMLKRIDSIFTGTFSRYGEVTYTDELKEWKAEAGIPDDQFKKLIEDGFLRHQHVLYENLQERYSNAQDSRNKYNHIVEVEMEKVKEYEENVLPANNIASLNNVIQKLGLSYNEEEKTKLQEKGFVEFIEAQGYYSYSDEKKIDYALKVSGLGREALTSKNVEKIVVDKFTSALTKVSFEKDPNYYNEYPVYENRKQLNLIQNISKSKLFVENLSAYPDVQTLADAKFKELSGQLELKHGIFVTSEYLKKKMGVTETTIEPYQAYNTISEITELAKAMRVTADALTSSTLPELASKYLEEYFKKDSSERVLSGFGLEMEVLGKMGISPEELNKKAEATFLEILKSNEENTIWKMRDVSKNFVLSEDFKKSSDVITAEVSFLENLVAGKKTSGLVQLLGVVELPKSAIDSHYFIELKEKIIVMALNDTLGAQNLKIIADKLDFSNCKEFLKTDFVQEKIREIIAAKVVPIIPKILSDYHSGYERKGFVLKDGKLTFVNTREYRNEAGEGVYQLLDAVNVATYLDNKELVGEAFMNEIRKDYSTSKNISHLKGLTKLSTELSVLGVNEKIVKEYLLDSLIKGIGVLTYSVSVPERENGRGGSSSIDYLFVPKAEEMKMLKKDYALTDEEERQLALAGFTYWLTNEKNRQEQFAKDLFDMYHFTSAETHEIVHDIYSQYIAKGWTERAVKLKNSFNLKVDTTEIDRGLERTFIASLQLADVASIVTQAKNLSPEFLETKQVQAFGRVLFLKKLAEEKEEEARTVKSLLSLEVSVDDITKANPLAEKFIERLRENFPKLAEKYQKSVDAFISIYSKIGSEEVFTLLEVYPFLSEAISNNEQYGLKLLFKFETLDKLSKNNIKTLYDAKKEILAEREIDPSSRDFRIAMQNKLAEYRRNGKIVEAMSNCGVNVETWLNYEDEMYFDLGKETSNISEQIQGSVDRIAESVDKFVGIYKEVIGEYEKELTSHKVPVDDKEKLTQDLGAVHDAMEAAIKEGKPEKVAGIKKGIANLEKQVSNPKTVAAWSRFIGDIGRFSALKKDIVGGVEALKEAERKMAELDATSSPREKRKELQKIKGQLENQKADILVKSNKFDLLVNKFKIELKGYLNGVLGEGRSASLMQEVDERIAEPLDHCVTDFGTLRNALEDKKENDLDGTTLRIGLWDRNPDVDLYMGNYTDCCIRIDSEHMGSESTIADYITDLGMQVVAIYDEKKKIPVAAAWAWIGMDDEDEISFVVDNVEANTQYSSKYRGQMQTALKAYLESFAKAIGVPKIMQGKANNDLVVGSMDSAYFKVGGYNRASGYFLEGEDNHQGGDHDHDGE